MLGDPNWGCKLLSRVFNYQGVVVAELIKEHILDAVSKYEPRITMTTNDITLVVDTNVIHIYLNYEIKATGEVNSYNMDITANDNPDKI